MTWLGKFKLFLGFVAIALGVSMSLWFDKPQVVEISSPSVKIAGQDIKVDIADTPEKQTQGLSGRPSLREDEGMLFIFKNPGLYSFWMKDMNFAIDMIWIGEDMRAVHIKKDARPEDGLTPFGPKVNSKYVLEVVSGFSDKYGLKEGDLAEFLISN